MAKRDQNKSNENAENIDSTGGDGGPAETTKAKRPAVTKRIWLKGETETKDPREADGLSIEVIGAGTYTAHLDEFNDAVRNALTVFGLNIVLTNTMGGKRGDEALELMLSRHETLANGEWSSRGGEAGPRISLLAEAWATAYEKAGKTKKDGTPLTIEEAAQFLRDGDEDYRKKVAATPQVAAEYARLKAEAAARRAEEAAKKAGEATGADDLDV